MIVVRVKCKEYKLRVVGLWVTAVAAELSKARHDTCCWTKGMRAQSVLQVISAGGQETGRQYRTVVVLGGTKDRLAGKGCRGLFA